MKRKQFEKLSAIDGTDYGFDPEQGKFAAKGICSWGAAAVTAVGAYSSSKSNKQASKATGQQLGGISDATKTIKDTAQQATTTLKPAQALFAPATQQLQEQAARYGQIGQQGQTALTTQQQALNVNQFLDPSMQFQMDEGRKALEASASARGGLLSGAALKDLTKYSQGLASENYNTAVSQALANRAQQIGIGGTMSQLGGNQPEINQRLFGTGANALGQVADIQSGVGQDVANLQMSAGNVAATGTKSKSDPLLAGVGAAVGSFFSDMTVKHDIASVTDDEIEEFLNSMKPATYEYDESVKEKGAPNGRQMGVMAQDVEKSKMGTKLVKKNQDDIKVIDVPKSVSALLASAANLNDRVNKLEGK
jgi:hypothetical protein